jgi:hypothetical protein
MNKAKYGVVEKDRNVQDVIPASLVEHPIEGVAYLFLMNGGPISAADITTFLTVSDTWLTEQFDNAVVQLEVNGFAKKAEDGATDPLEQVVLLADFGE